MKKALYSIFYMFSITLVFTSLVSAVKFFNEDKIRQNEKIKFQKIVLQVLGMPIKDSGDKDIGLMFDQRIRQNIISGRTVYIAYENQGQGIMGYAFNVGGSGFWGPVQAMVALDPNLSTMTGISFYKHSETPGLGARITEDWFTRQFIGLPLRSITKDEHFFYLKPEGAEKGEKDLDAISGATGTSRAVEKFLNAELYTIIKDVSPVILKDRKG